MLEIQELNKLDPLNSFESGSSTTSNPIEPVIDVHRPVVNNAPSPAVSNHTDSIDKSITNQLITYNGNVRKFKFCVTAGIIGISMLVAVVTLSMWNDRLKNDGNDVKQNPKVNAFVSRKTNMTCSDIGVYTITLHYNEVSDQSCKFDIDKTNRQLRISSNEKGDLIFVSCEMSNICSDAYLSLYINDGNSTTPVRTEKLTGCKDDSTKITRQIALNKTMISSNNSISCKPNTDEIEFIDNLIITTQICKGRHCSETCKEEEKGLYFEHQMFCNKFYQCEYPALHLRPCPDNEQWNPDACTCDLMGNTPVKCNNVTKTYDPAINSENIKACGGL